jgi:hypothetical protein
MDRFMSEAPDALLIASALSAGLSLSRFPWNYRVRAVRDDETLELGRHTLTVLETPHVHHWDSMMLLENSTRSLFPSDLFLQPHDQPPIVSEDLATEMWVLSSRCSWPRAACFAPTTGRPKICPSSGLRLSLGSGTEGRALSSPRKAINSCNAVGTLTSWSRKPSRRVRSENRANSSTVMSSGAHPAASNTVTRLHGQRWAVPSRSPRGS